MNTKRPGNRIQSLREKNSWQRIDLAVRAGVSERTIFNLETLLPSKQRPAYKSTQEKIAGALSVEVKHLFKHGRAR